MMTAVANVLVLIVALLHLWALVLEMFLWTKPFGMRTFGMTPEVAQASAKLAANQGLYNGFLAAGLIWGVIANDHAVQVFFLICVMIAGVFGALTAKRSILWFQAFPGAFALLAVLAAR
jgi:putative membrane protein